MTGISVTALEIVGGGKIALFSGLTRTVHLTAGAATQGATAPSATTVGNMRGLAFSADAELAFIVFDIPGDWDGKSDLTLGVDWVGTAGDAVADTETVKFDIAYYSIAVGEAVDNGTEATATTTRTQSGAGTDKEYIHMELTIDFNGANQPITAGDHLLIKFNRDVTTDTYSGNTNVFAWDLDYTADELSTDS